jgi:AbrB family looped-hinge helix DNA binding protein
MDVAAQLNSKGQITIPKPVRDALGLAEGDEVVFSVQGHVVTLARAPDFLGLAGTVDVPARQAHRSVADVVRRT